jgi:oligoribonuclease
MKYLSIDIETTGLDPETCQILSVGIIVEDTNNVLPYDKIPKFHCAINREHISGSPYAINMNKDLIGKISEYQTLRSDEKKQEFEKSTGMLFLKEGEVTKRIFHFLYDAGFSTVDTDGWSHAQMGNYFETAPNGKMYPMIGMHFKKISINCAGKNFATFDKKFLEKLPYWDHIFRIKQRVIDPSVIFTDWKNDEALPSLSDCKKRSGMNEHVAHDAIEDAWDVIQLLRTQYV